MKYESLEQLAALQHRINGGEVPSDEELAAAVEFARQERLAVAGRSASTRKKAAANTVDLKALLTSMATGDKS